MRHRVGDLFQAGVLLHQRRAGRQESPKAKVIMRNAFCFYSEEAKFRRGRRVKSIHIVELKESIWILYCVKKNTLVKIKVIT